MASYISFRGVALLAAIIGVIAISAKVIATNRIDEALPAIAAPHVYSEIKPANAAPADNEPLRVPRRAPLLNAASVTTQLSVTSSGTRVLRVANSYKNGGGFNWDSGTGTPDEIRFKGVRILSKAKSGTYCCGFTFAVAMRSAEEAGLLKDKTVRQIRRFQQHWYAATVEAKEKQQIYAIQWLGIGREVPFLQAEPGDFVRLWHGSSGHSVILVRWIMENGRKAGIEYRGTQSSTDGIGNHIEYMEGAAGHRGGFIQEQTYAARLN